MASSRKMDYEIISDPFDPRCVVACSMYQPGDEPKKAKRLLERIRGKEENLTHSYTPYEEYTLINEQIRKTDQGFDVNFSIFRCLFNFYRSLLDESNSTKKPETDREYFGRLAEEAIANYNMKEETSFEFVEVEKANVYMNSGYIYFITFVAKDPCDYNRTKVFQAKVCNVLCREIEHSFCRLKPGQQVERREDSKKVLKKPRIQD